MFNKLKQFKDLRSQAKQMQNSLAVETIEAQALSGRLQLTMDGNQKVKSIYVDPELLTVDQKSKLEDGIKDLFDNAHSAMQKTMMKKMRAGEIDMPDLSSLGM